MTIGPCSVAPGDFKPRFLALTGGHSLQSLSGVDARLSPPKLHREFLDDFNRPKYGASGFMSLKADRTASREAGLIAAYNQGRKE
jgi:hypothetical protein